MKKYFLIALSLVTILQVSTQASTETKLIMESRSGQKNHFMVKDDDGREFFNISIKNSKKNSDFFAEVSEGGRVVIRAFPDSTAPTTPRKIFFEDEDGNQVGHAVEESTPNKVRLSFYDRRDMLIGRAIQNKVENGLLEIQDPSSTESQLISVLKHDRKGFSWQQSFSNEIIDSKWVFAYVGLVSREQASSDSPERVKTVIATPRPNNQDSNTVRNVIIGTTAIIGVSGAVYLSYKLVKGAYRLTKHRVGSALGKLKSQIPVNSPFSPQVQSPGTYAPAKPLYSVRSLPSQSQAFAPDPSGPNHGSENNRHSILKNY